MMVLCIQVVTQTKKRMRRLYWEMDKKSKGKFKHQRSLAEESFLDRLRGYVVRSRRGQNKRIQEAIAHIKK
jgi:hypothetical protein